MSLDAGNLAAVSEPQVRVAAKDDTDDVLNALTQAFADDPVVRWVFSEDETHFSKFPRFVRAFGGGAIACGTALVSEGSAGAALWLPPGETPDEEAVMAVMAEATPEDRAEEISDLFEALDQYHPHEAHWYLPLVGVVPARQGEGIGSAFLTRALQRCDEDRLPAYLEATSERNKTLYMRHGFESVREICVARCRTVTPMLPTAR